MKVRGVIRAIDDLGRIVIPAEIRKHFDLNVRDKVTIYMEGDRIVVEKVRNSFSCVFCGDENAPFEFKGRSLCPKCMEELTHAKSNKH